MRRILCLAGALATTIAMASSAAAATVTLNLTASSTGSFASNIRIDQTPVGSTGAVIAVGQVTTDTTNQLGTFIAWCLDLAASVGLNQSNPYIVTTTPYSNSSGLDSGARLRVTNMFNANYATLDTSSAVQAAAFQTSLWETLYDTGFDLASGDFRAVGRGTDAGAIDLAAAGFLAAGQAYVGPDRYRMSFLESTGTGDARRQNLVTATAAAAAVAVPAPGAALLLIAALGSLAGLRKRRHKQG